MRINTMMDPFAFSKQVIFFEINNFRSNNLVNLIRRLFFDTMKLDLM